MEFRAIVVSMPLGAFFLFSGLVINLIQATSYVIVRPLSKKAFRRVNGLVAQLLWLQLIWFMEWWASLKVELHTDMETYKLMGKEHAILMSNHIADVDILITLLLAWRVGCLRSALMVVKKSAQYLPIFGWASWFFEFVFLDRKWDQDERRLKSSFQGLQDFPRPFWLTIFVEGTRITPERLLAAQDYAVSKGLPVPRNVMIPRTKGFVSAVKYTRSFVPAIYDVTVAVPERNATPSLLRLFKGQSSVVKVHVKRYSMDELPQSDALIAQWCRDKFTEKDALLDQFSARGTFEDKQIKNSGRSTVLHFCIIFSWGLFFLGFLKLCQELSIFSTWRGVSLITLGVAMTAALLHLFIEYTKLPFNNNNNTRVSS